MAAGPACEMNASRAATLWSVTARLPPSEAIRDRGEAGLATSVHPTVAADSGDLSSRCCFGRLLHGFSSYKETAHAARAAGTLSSGSEVTPAVTRTLHCAVIALRSRAVSSQGAAPPDKSELWQMHRRR